MEKAEYEIMFRHENDHWWYVALRDLIRSSLPTPHATARLLDAGCGTGRLLEELSGWNRVGLDASPEVFPFLRRRALTRAVQASVRQIPFPDASFDVVVSADVLCCLGAPGDADALLEIARVLRPGGLVLLNLPAYESLRSHHDLAVHTKRRYTRHSLSDLITSSGLILTQLTYRNTILFPIIAALRSAQRLRSPSPVQPRSDLRPTPSWVNRLCLTLLQTENQAIRAGFHLPFGLSLFCVARKPPHEPAPPPETATCHAARP